MVARSWRCIAACILLAICGLHAGVAAAKRPNIVFILVDDQDLLLDSLDRMENVQNHLIQKGVFFKKHYGHVSQCCPARASIWTGMHAHNTNVTNVFNGRSGGGWEQVRRQGFHQKHLGVWMQQAGYETYYTGKIYNGFEQSNYCGPCLEGWSGASILTDPNTYFYYNPAFANYQGVFWWSTESNEYSTDVVADNVVSFIGNASKLDKPFFAVAAPVAPHFPATPKKEYAGLYPDLEVPKSPNFNPKNRTGVGPVWALDRLDEKHIKQLNHAYRQRQQSLKSVDDLVNTILQKLEETGNLENTYIIYSSDNGYHIGNHRLDGGKLQCFEEDINVPLIIRGPDVAKNQTTDMVTGHVDIAPTILSLAGADMSYDGIDVHLDGTPITFPLQDSQDFERNLDARGETTHLEYWGPFQQEWVQADGPQIGLAGLNTYKALRLQTSNYSLMYSVWCGEAAHELYDMTSDPYQLVNLHPDAPSEAGQVNAYRSGMNTMLGRPIDRLLHRLDALVLILKTCTGHECRWPWRQLHPDNKVHNLSAALDVKYDDFYANSYRQARVGWLECYTGFGTGGADSTLYSVANEQPTWSNDTVFHIVTGRVRQSASSRTRVSIQWAAFLIASTVYTWL